MDVTLRRTATDAVDGMRRSAMPMPVRPVPAERGTPSPAIATPSVAPSVPAASPPPDAAGACRRADGEARSRCIARRRAHGRGDTATVGKTRARAATPTGRPARRADAAPPGADGPAALATRSAAR